MEENPEPASEALMPEDEQEEYGQLTGQDPTGEGENAARLGQRSRIHESMQDGQGKGRVATLIAPAATMVCCLIAYVLAANTINSRWFSNVLIGIFAIATLYLFKNLFSVGGWKKNPAIQRAPKFVELENMSANGGAVGATVLGGLTIIGSVLTSWSLINGVLGVGLGIWGLGSKKRPLAVLGILLSAVGSLLCVSSIGETMNDYFLIEAVPEEF